VTVLTWRSAENRGFGHQRAKDDKITRGNAGDGSSALIGSPEQVIDKVGRYHEQLGHEVIHLSAERRCDGQPTAS
jgi:alkanesulfonate monooxygenase SsuD/methylene tetrahydromethanopterin reductase-like flavin-dependent oxidoreductase (luciferase family)